MLVNFHFKVFAGFTGAYMGLVGAFTGLIYGLILGMFYIFSVTPFSLVSKLK